MSLRILVCFIFNTVLAKDIVVVKPTLTLNPKFVMYDLSFPTTVADLVRYYDAMLKQWKLCTKCGVPSLGTGIHLEQRYLEPLHPALIPAEYLLTRLVLIDVSSNIQLAPSSAVTLDSVRTRILQRCNRQEATLLVFKFNWVQNPDTEKYCVCNNSGLSLELATWITRNLPHVVGVATDSPTLESDETRDSNETISSVLAHKGIYMVENVDLKRDIPVVGCLALTMPLNLLTTYHVPARLTAFCPPDGASYMRVHIDLITEAPDVRPSHNDFNTDVFA